MKPIGELLLYLLRPDVAELGFVSNRLPSANVGGRFMPVDEKAPTTETILQILATLGGAQHVGSLGPKAIQWNAKVDGVGVINVAAIMRDGVVQVRFTLSKREAPAAVPASAPTEPRMTKPVAHLPELEMPSLSNDDDGDDEPTLQTISERPPPVAPGVSAAVAGHVPDLALDTRKTAPLQFDAFPKGRPQLSPSEMNSVMYEALADLGYGGPQGDISSGLEIDDGHRIDGALVDTSRLTSGHRARHHTPVNLHAAVVPGAAPAQAPGAPAGTGASAKVRVPSGHDGAGGGWSHEGTVPMGMPAEALRASAAEIDEGARVAVIERYAQAALQRGATDIHLVAERPPLIRVAGNLVPLEEGVLRAADVERIVLSVVPSRLRETLDKDGSCDFALVHPRLARFRANASRQRTGYKLALRVIPHKVPTLEQLGLPASISLATKHHQGLIVVTGPTGHGKTTTMAAIVNLINEHSSHHVITVEDPIEYLHARKKAMMSQREVGQHTKSFFAALKGSLREDPDVIVVGELRDLETVRMAVSAAETGHLVIGTMNTPSAAKTIDRVIDMFPPQDQAQIRITLAGALRLIVSQRLVPTSDGKRVVAAAELLPGSIALSTLIRDNKTFQIPSLQQRGKALGIIRLNESLSEHVHAGRITVEAARAASDNLPDLEAMINPKAATAQSAPAPARR